MCSSSKRQGVVVTARPCEWLLGWRHVFPPCVGAYGEIDANQHQRSTRLGRARLAVCARKAHVGGYASFEAHPAQGLGSGGA